MNSRDDKERQDHTPDDPGDKSDSRGCGPGAENIAGDVQPDRNGQSGQSPDGRKPRAGEPLEERVEERARRETRVDAQASPADGRGEPPEIKTPFRDLMAEGCEDRIDQRGDPGVMEAKSGGGDGQKNNSESAK